MRLIHWLKSQYIDYGDPLITSFCDYIKTNAVTIGVVIVSAVVIVLPIIFWYFGNLETGFSDKTLWEWFELLAVPIVVAIILGLFGIRTQKAGQRAENERRLDKDRAQESSLREYLDRISELVLKNKLAESTEESSVRAIAQARTLSVLKNLTGVRKGILITFLHDSKLITKGRKIISFTNADLTGSYLNYANLAEVDFSEANLREADLIGANLSGANLQYCRLVNAKLVGSNLTQVDLSHADLRDADLRDADLTNANLYMSRQVTVVQLSQAKCATGARMPDDQVMTEELWNKFKQEPGDFSKFTEEA